MNTSKSKSGMPLVPSAQVGACPDFVLSSQEYEIKECLENSLFLKLHFSIPSATHREESQPAEETDCLAEARG